MTAEPLEVVVLARRYGVALLQTSGSTVYAVLMLQSTKDIMRVPPNQRLQLTPLRGPEIGAFLKTNFGSTVIPI
jgi:hypothetical protein